MLFLFLLESHGLFTSGRRVIENFKLTKTVTMILDTFKKVSRMLLLQML